MTLAVGTRIGRYRIDARLGAGGMGEVWQAFDERLGRRVAIKVLPAEFAADPDRLRRFEQEARATAALNHPNILAIHDIGLEGDTPYIVEELLEGGTLGDLMRREPIPWRRALEIAALIGDGLAAAHARGFVHRDLKPGNVFVTKDDLVKILDFGLAKLLPDTSRTVDLADAPTTVAATQPRVVMGTIGYMAPEQVRGEGVDHRADIFALGCVLHEMLTGQSAFRRHTDAETLAAILRDTAPEPSRLVRDLSPAVDQVVRHCLEKDPAQRFQSAGNVSSALRSLLQGTGPVVGTHVLPPAAGDARPSIAVLSFANLSGDPEQEYFCDGIAEEIITALAHVEGLRVVARTSSFAFKGRSVDIREVGRRLDVGAVLEGSVRLSGDRLRITAQLIDVTDGCHLWSERFDRRFEDVFAIQDEISLAIVDHLRVELLSDEHASVVRRHTDSFDAYNAYLMGLYEWNKMSPEGFARSHEHFREAIRLDPRFAPAYAQLADAATSPTWWADQEPAVALSTALPLAQRALALDANLAHAHSVLGHCRSFFERNWVAGERSLRRAVEIAPNDAFAQTYLALHLVAQGADDEASDRGRLAWRLDPLSPAVNTWSATVLVYAGHLAEGTAALERQAASTPRLWLTRYFLSSALEMGRRSAEARVEAEKAVELSDGASVALSHLGGLCYRTGDRARGDEMLARLEERARTGYVSPMLRALVWLARGDTDEAVRHAEAAMTAKDPWAGSYRIFTRGPVPNVPRIEALFDRPLD